jgi:hypothetical protein
MEHQPNLFSHEPPAGTQQEAAKAPAPRPPLPQLPWMSLIEIWVSIVVQLYLGLLIFALPWLHFWTENSLFTYSPVLLAFGSSGFVRGAVSGLGLLNVYLACAEAIRARRLR